VGGGLLRPRGRAPKIRYSLVRELAENDIPVAVACRVLGVPGPVTATGSAGSHLFEGNATPSW
jgi:hypothetical protein